MADLRDVYGNPVRQTDEYGNPIRQTGGTMGSYDTGSGGYGGGGQVGGYDTTGTGYGGTTGTGYGGIGTGLGGGGYDTGMGVDQPPIQNQYGGVTVPTTTGTGTQLRRSGSSSSSSSEDDGMGGRRKKKGLKEKIKEKLPGGGHKQDEYGTTGTYGTTTTSTTTGPGYDTHGKYAGTEHHEKKGIMDKIKEKLPGHH
ncbi:hypothetical protein RND81_11G208200 [Saponaria officinalis]|uniref:Dehydrin n=1 Tax=Saponaria officinalis TaxID=3572 RepID=A0AAW1HPP3_SAPOF